MEVTASDVARIPRSNLRVPVTDFAQVWTAAERRSREQGERHVIDWYAGGVALTCRWLAAATVRPAEGRPYLAKAPVTKRTARAHEELIEAELLAAEKLDMQRPRPYWLAKRPEWSKAICATLRWAWRRSGPPPLPLLDFTATD